MTNTSEPHSDDMVVQASNPISFDWMGQGNLRFGVSAEYDGMGRKGATFWFVLCLH